MNETLAELKLQRHPDKTFIGRVSRGFEVLGYRLTSAGLEVAPRAEEHCAERMSLLYEGCVDLIHIGAGVRRWLRRARSGLRAMSEDRPSGPWDLSAAQSVASGSPTDLCRR